MVTQQKAVPSLQHNPGPLPIRTAAPVAAFPRLGGPFWSPVAKIPLMLCSLWRPLKVVVRLCLPQTPSLTTPEPGQPLLFGAPRSDRQLGTWKLQHPQSRPLDPSPHQ